MACFDAADYPSTESDSMSYLNEADFEGPVRPMSDYKWVRPSTLPSIPWPHPTRRASRTPQKVPLAGSAALPSDSSEFTFFPETEEYLADKARTAAGGSRPTNAPNADEFSLLLRTEKHINYMSRRGIMPPPSTRTRQIQLNSLTDDTLPVRAEKQRGRRKGLRRKTQPGDPISRNPVNPRRSSRIAALNATKAQQGLGPLAPLNVGNKVTKRSEEPSPRTRRKVR